LKSAETYDQRFSSWISLRNQVQSLPLYECCLAINQWWFSRPWCVYRLHWDDQENWPDPWTLLEDRAYCDIARGLGILYTCGIINRPDLQDVVLFEEQKHNLVLVRADKYILNYSSLDILNTCLDIGTQCRSVTYYEIQQKIQQTWQ
jgi:hypothetical protein